MMYTPQFYVVRKWVGNDGKNRLYSRVATGPHGEYAEAEESLKGLLPSPEAVYSIEKLWVPEYTHFPGGNL